MSSLPENERGEQDDRDFDSDDFTVEATSLKEAKEKAEATGKLRFAKYEPHIYLIENN